MRWIAPTLLVLAAVLAPPVHAGFQFGVAHVDEVDGVSSHGYTLAWLTDARHPWEFSLGHIAGRRSGSGPRTPSVNYLAVSRQLTWRSWFASGGIAYTTSNTEVLSEHWQFMTGLGWRGERVALSLRHLSNANTGGRNRGENLLILEYRF